MREIIDVPNGKKFLMENLTPGDRFDFLSAVGSNWNSAPYMFTAEAVCSVREIDGVAISLPSSVSELKARADELGDAGVDAATEWLQKNNKYNLPNKEAAKN